MKNANLIIEDGVINGYYKTSNSTSYLVETKSSVLNNQVSSFTYNGKYYIVINSMSLDDLDKIIYATYGSVQGVLNKEVSIVSDTEYVYALVINGEMVVLQNYILSNAFMGLPVVSSLVKASSCLDIIYDKYGLTKEEFVRIVRERLNTRRLVK